MIAASTTIPVAATDVWAALQVAETWEGVAGIEAIHDVRHTPDGLLEAFAFHITTAGLRFDAVATVTRRSAPHAMTLDLESKDVSARVVARVKGDDAPVTLAVGIQLEPRSVLVRMAIGAVERAIRSGLPRELRAFGERLAAGHADD